MTQTADEECVTACTKLCVDFANGVDARLDQKVASLFSPRGRFDHITGSFEGRDAILEMLRQRPQNMVTRHLCTNIDVTPQGESQAHGRSYITVFLVADSDGKLPLKPVLPLFVEYHDLYVKVDGRWAIQQRRPIPVFV